MKPTIDDLRADAWARIRHVKYPETVQEGLLELADIDAAEAGNPASMRRVADALERGYVLRLQSGVRLVVPK